MNLLPMNLFPQRNEFIEMLSRCIQDLLHIGSFGIRWANRVSTVCQGNIAIRSEIDNHFRFA